jgi:small-conductance mechanosensitive channel
MNRYINRIFPFLLIFFLFLTSRPSEAVFPEILKAIEPRLYQGSPQEIEAFIQERLDQADQLISEVNLLLQKETKEENKQALANALEFLEGLSFQFTRLRREIKTPSDVAVTPPSIGSSPYSLKVLDETLVFYRQVKQKLHEYQKKKKLIEENLSNIEEDLKPLLIEYIDFKKKDEKNVKIYETLGQLLSLQVEYALKKVQTSKLDQTIDSLDSLAKEYNNQTVKIFDNLKITQEDINAAKKQKEQAEQEEKDLKEKLIAKQRELNRRIIIFELRLDNIISKLKSIKLAEASKNLLNIEKKRLEAQLEGLQHQKETLIQDEIAAKLNTIDKDFRYDWLTYYIDYPQSKKVDIIVKDWTKRLNELDDTSSQLKDELAQRRLDKSIINENLFTITKERETATSSKVKEALKVLHQQINTTNDSLDKLIRKISDNFNNAQRLKTEIRNILQLIQKRISFYERLLYLIKANFLAAWIQIKGVIYYPLWSIGDSAVTLATLLKVIFFLFLGIFFLRWIRKKLAEFLIEKARLSIGVVNSIATLSYYFLLLLVVLVALSTAGVNLSQITIILGALGVGIGFGLQTIANNFISGLILLTERTIKVGDIVELENGLIGEVKNVSIRSTVIRTYHGLDLIVPNSDFISNRVTTWTYGDDWRRLRIPFGVSYDSDPDEVAKIATEIAREIPTTVEDDEHPINVWFEGFGDSSLNFSLLVWCRMTQLKPISGLFSDYYFALFRKFKEAGIEIPFPQRDLHLRSISPKIMESFKKKNEKNGT